jgi:hypothetical protein
MRFDSSSATVMPSRLRRAAAVMPVIPAPTTATSTVTSSPSDA